MGLVGNLSQLSKSRSLVGILIVTAVISAGHLVPGIDNSPIELGIRDALHTLVFAVYSVAVVSLLGRQSAAKASVVTLLLVGTTGCLGEFLQLASGKEFNVTDLGRDLSGAVLGLGSWQLWRLSGGDEISAFRGRLLRTGSVISAALVVTPLVYWLGVIVLTRSMFPTVVSFDHGWEKNLYAAINSEIIAPVTMNGGEIFLGSGVEIRLSEWGRSGLRILPPVSDWTEYEYLSFTAMMLDGPDTKVTVRINDNERLGGYSDRFMATIIVKNMPVRFRIPLPEIIYEPGSRPMDLTDVQELVVFARDGRDGTVMLLDQVQLE
jgi:hypothetical protein